MAGEPPGGGAVKAGGAEGIEAQLCSACMDIVGNSLESIEVGDFIDRMAGLLEQSLVYDDAERLVAVTGGKHFAVLAKEVEVIGGHFLVEVGVLQIEAVLAPGVQSTLVAALEQRGGLALVHLGGQSGLIVAGSSGNDLYGYSGELGVLLSQLLPSGVGFGLEVEIIDGTGCSGLLGGLLRGRRSAFLGGFSLVCSRCRTGCHREYHSNSQQQCQKLLHFVILSFYFISARQRPRKFNSDLLPKRLCGALSPVLDACFLPGPLSCREVFPRFSAPSHALAGIGW